MDLQKFYRHVEKCSEINGVGFTECGAVIKNINTDVEVEIPFNTIKKHSWSEIHAVLTGDKSAHPLEHMTRIVGYFSRTTNWNKSKIGELKDRQNGQYGL